MGLVRFRSMCKFLTWRKACECFPKRSPNCSCNSGTCVCKKGKEELKTKSSLLTKVNQTPNIIKPVDQKPMQPPVKSQQISTIPSKTSAVSKESVVKATPPKPSAPKPPSSSLLLTLSSEKKPTSQGASKQSKGSAKSPISTSKPIPPSKDPSKLTDANKKETSPKPSSTPKSASKPTYATTKETFPKPSPTPKSASKPIVLTKPISDKSLPSWKSTATSKPSVVTPLKQSPPSAQEKAASTKKTNVTSATPVKKTASKEKPKTKVTEAETSKATSVKDTAKTPSSPKSTLSKVAQIFSPKTSPKTKPTTTTSPETSSKTKTTSPETSPKTMTSPETSPKTTMTSPKTTMTSPKTTMTSPETTMTSPKTTMTSPETTMTSPKTMTSPATSPKTMTSPATSPKTMTSPKTSPKTTTSPKTAMTSPKTTMTSPETTMTSPKTTMASPETTMTSPKTTMASPETTMTSPKTTMASPETTMTSPETTKMDARVRSRKFNIVSVPSMIIGQSRKLFTPGPLMLSDRVRSAMMIDTSKRHSDFSYTTEFVRGALLQIAKVPRTEYTTIPVDGNSAFITEATLRTVMGNQGKELLIMTNGRYGDRVSQICKRSGIQNTCIPVDKNALTDALASKKVDGVVALHCEGSTGRINPVEEFGEIIKKFSKDTMFFVDASVTFGSVPLNMKNIDFMMSTSGKSFHSVSGIAYVIAKKDLLQKHRQEGVSLIMDLGAQHDELERTGDFRFSPPIYVMLAFKEALLEFSEEGSVEGRAKRYKANNTILKEEMARIGFKRLHETDESPYEYHITSFKYPNNPLFVFREFYNRLSDSGFLIVPEKFTLPDSFNVATMGNMSPEDVRELTKNIRQVCNDMRIEVPIFEALY